LVCMHQIFQSAPHVMGMRDRFGMTPLMVAHHNHAPPWVLATLSLLDSLSQHKCERRLADQHPLRDAVVRTMLILPLAVRGLGAAAARLDAFDSILHFFLVIASCTFLAKVAELILIVNYFIADVVKPEDKLTAFVKHIVEVLKDLTHTATMHGACRLVSIMLCSVLAVLVAICARGRTGRAGAWTRAILIYKFASAESLTMESAEALIVETASDHLVFTRQRSTATCIAMLRPIPSPNTRLRGAWMGRLHGTT